jgi:ribosomal protein S18 acetylase RimI-like enzyme
MEVEPVGSVDPRDLAAFVRSAWRAEFVVAHGERIQLVDLAGFVATDEAHRIVGHVSFRFDEESCEITSIAAEPRHRGIGSRLLDAALAAAREAGRSRVWLTTTNDNVDALRFYQRRGFRVVRLRPGAVDEARRTLKSELPEVGSHGIPMRDELDLELNL